MLLDQAVPLPGQIQRYAGLHGSSDALALSQFAVKATPLVIITETAQDAQRLAEEIPYFAPQLKVNLLPDWETLPYDSFSPHQDLVSERLATLYHITHNDCDIAIAPVTTALYSLPPPSYLAAYTFLIKQGEKLHGRTLRSQLALAGYSHVTQVVSPGEFSVRGGLIDLFPMGCALPYRIDLLDDEIESIRTFDVDTQRSVYPVNEIRLLPAREFPLDKDGQERFRRNFRERFEGDPSRSSLYKDVSQGLAPAGIEYYLPLFFDETATLFDYLPQAAALCLHRDVMRSLQHFWRDTQSRYELLRGDRSRPLLPPQELFLSVDRFFACCKSFPRVEIAAEENPGAVRCATAALPPLAVDRRAQNPLSGLSSFLEQYSGRVLLLVENLGRREVVNEYLSEHGLKPVVCESFEEFWQSSAHFMLCASALQNGFILEKDRVAIVTESELYASQVRRRVRREAARRSSAEGILRDLSEIRSGDPVVHESHGIGRYLGLVSMDQGEGATEFLVLEYAEKDKLYVPVSQLHLISRYSGAAPEAAPLHKLGSSQWDKAKKKAMRQVRDTAAELLNLYAQRASRQGHAFSFKPHDYDAFVERFEFEETPDQAAAIQSVIEDLTHGKPMDRLICGDVGFGKTEVALRAAFIAAMDGKQVAVLVPTTLLVEQHFQNFTDRFAEWPIKIVELSRFRSNKEQAQTLQGLSDGTIDIVIGTHKLIQKGVKFKRLGLVIIDEEHRFGVRQKEKLKALRAEVDVLTLTATPIPRTLAMSLEGLRDFSVITTAPERRLAIKTFVTPYNQGIIREAALRELKRGGQVYFLHNEISTIETMYQRLAKLLPEARIHYAHGQMRERELERVMRDFYQQRFNLLLSTAIIETGIDIPTANTMIINRADKFGLAQLHQLRGRVGRSHHQAYAYLLTPDEEAVSAQARKRLEAIQMMEELGSGFYLAMHDLEIRGAGEILGEAQSGEMQEVGFNLYNQMLGAAVQSLKNGIEPDLSQPLGVTTEINLHTPALLPEHYCNDIHERLVLYKRLANCETLEELDLMHEELVDRFGPPPQPAKVLLDTHRLRILGKPLGVLRIDATDSVIQLQFIPKPPVNAAKIIRLIQQKQNFRLNGPDRLRIEAKLPDIKARVAAIKEAFNELS
ncbi:MAG TPA: transcription-repair coupling factor [Burkholderiales bacterium]|nr:transcription-repair coupling factor [Burkholderiales bacterium]